MKEFKGNEFSVVRQHEEFVWLHDSLVEDERYAGLLVFFFVQLFMNFIKPKNIITNNLFWNS